jgi:hypothetical protein
MRGSGIDAGIVPQIMESDLISVVGVPDGIIVVRMVLRDFGVVHTQDFGVLDDLAELDPAASLFERLDTGAARTLDVFAGSTRQCRASG